MSSPVSWGAKPSAKKSAAQQSEPSALDAFVHPGQERATKRLNLNIPGALHARIKAQCALEGRDMTQTLIELLEQRFPAK